MRAHTAPRSQRQTTFTRGATALVAGAIVVGAFGTIPGQGADAAQAAPTASAYNRVATYPVFQNVPAGVDATLPTVAEISAVTDDGNTVIYTDALGKRIGFLDITDPGAPTGLGTISLADLGHADDQPTSVAVYGDYVLVVIDESGDDYVNPSGRLDVLRISDRTLVASIDLLGQPDSIAISADKKYAAIAIENQRDESATPAGRAKGDLPQLPAGFVQVIDLNASPTSWLATPIALVAPDGSALPEFTAAGIVEATDPEPEYVAINSANKLALTLQENNGIVVIDLATRAIEKVFSAGSVAVSGIDTKKDGKIDLTGSIPATPREPDSIAWVDDTHVATANEGDWKGGTRGWTIFDATTGAVSWDAGNTFERLAVQHGVYNDDRAAKKGSEPEGLAVSTVNGVRYGFVASERSNFVAVYDLSNPVNPVFQQLLFATNGPEGVLSIPSRGLLVVSSETDDASIGVRASVAIYQRGSAAAQAPTIISDTVDGTATGAPIGWNALGALSAAPGQPGTLYTASDSALKPSTIFTVDTTKTPAHITTALVVTQAGTPANFDIEGIFARPQGGFWLASEGATGAANKLYRTDAAGAVVETVSLPTEISDHINKWGYEGVTAITDADGNEQLFVAIQRPLWTDPASTASTSSTIDGAGVTRIGRYDVATASWTWFGYQLAAPSTPADWVGLSEIVAVDSNTLAVIERDKLNGPAAVNKRIYTVELPETDPVAGAPLTVLPKTLAFDALPALRSLNGWTQEKLEGLTIGADGNVYIVTDNDGLKDATGETVFLNIGTAAAIFGTGAVTPTPTPTGAPTPTPTGAPTPTDAPTPTPTGAPTPTPTGAPTPTDAPTPTPTGAPTPTPTNAPTPTEAPTESASLSLGQDTVAAGARLAVSGAGFVSGARVDFVLNSAPAALGSLRASTAGVVSGTLQIPAATPAGQHTIVASVDGVEVARVAVTVTTLAAAGSVADSGSDSLASTGVQHLVPWLAGSGALILAGVAALLIRVRLRRRSA